MFNEVAVERRVPESGDWAVRSTELRTQVHWVWLILAWFKKAAFGVALRWGESAKGARVPKLHRGLALSRVRARRCYVIGYGE